MTNYTPINSWMKRIPYLDDDPEQQGIPEMPPPPQFAPQQADLSSPATLPKPTAPPAPLAPPPMPKSEPEGDETDQSVPPMAQQPQQILPKLPDQPKPPSMARQILGGLSAMFVPRPISNLIGGTAGYQRQLDRYALEAERAKEENAAEVAQTTAQAHRAQAQAQLANANAKQLTFEQRYDSARKKGANHEQALTIASEGHWQEPKDAPGAKTTTTAEGIFQWNPATNKYDILVGKSPDKAEPAAAAKQEFQRVMTKLATEGLLDSGTAMDVHKTFNAINSSKSLSPEEKAGAKAYLQSNQNPAGQTTAIVLRSEMLNAGRPVQVIDPNNPDRVVMMTAGDAIKNGYSTPNSIDFSTNKGVQREFTVGQQGKQLTAIDTARYHMATFRRLADALQNGDTQALNQINNYFKEQFGSPAPTNFALAKEAFSAEVGRAFAVANVTQEERNSVGEAIKRAESPAQLMQAADTADELLSGKQKALRRSYEAGRQNRPNFGDNASNSPAAQGTKQSGHVTVTDPKGGIHTFPDQASADNFKRLAGIK